MKNFGFRVLVGLIAFAIGLQVVNLLNFQNIEKNVFSKYKTQIAYPKSLITVQYKGFTKNEDNSISAKFEITNNSPMKIFYLSGNQDYFQHDSVSLNGNDGKRMGYCGNVAMQMKEFSIEPNESRTFDVDLHRFNEFSFDERNQNVKVGYEFNLGDNENYGVFWSDNFALPNWVKEKIK